MTSFSGIQSQLCRRTNFKHLDWLRHFPNRGTHAHVPTPFTSPVLFLARYTNCGSGVIEMTQAVHNFAPPESAGPEVDQNYFNVGWGGVRTGTLPIALEKGGAGNATLGYRDPDGVDTVGQCPWSASQGREDQMVDLDQTPGYTCENSSLLFRSFPFSKNLTVLRPLRPLPSSADAVLMSPAFVTPGLRVNGATPPELPCRVNAVPCSSDNGATCMVDSCTDADIESGTHTRLSLRVPPGSTPNCRDHFGMTFARDGRSYPIIKCDIRDAGFGRNTARFCEPWSRVGFKRNDTGAVLEVATVKHWSWRWQDGDVFFAVYEEDLEGAMSAANGFFDNSNGTSRLDLEVVLLSSDAAPPADYDPGATESAFTYVYGRGRSYASLNPESGHVAGSSRRRLGTSDRDYTVFTVNWLAGAKVGPGETYVNRGYVFASELGAVESLGDGLAERVYVDKVQEVDYDGRRVDLYASGGGFAAVPASRAKGRSTECASPSASLACSGSSVPRPNAAALFYVTCGERTRVGFDPYGLSPDFGGSFPGHAPPGETVRAYACRDGEVSSRPTWRLLGFFMRDDAGCAELANATYDETVCEVSWLGFSFLHRLWHGLGSLPSLTIVCLHQLSPTSGPSEPPSLSPATPAVESSVTEPPSQGLSHSVSQYVSRHLLECRYSHIFLLCSAKRDPRY